MKKTNKFLVVLLSLIMTVVLLLTALFQASAVQNQEQTDILVSDSPRFNEATSDMAELDDYVKMVSIEITQPPKTTEFTRNLFMLQDLFVGLEMDFHYSDGRVYHYSYDEYGFSPFPISISSPEYVHVVQNINDLPAGKNTIQYEYNNLTADLDITLIEDEDIENPIVSLEMVKLPSKTFAEPMFKTSLEDEVLYLLSEKDSEWRNNKYANSISGNMDGAEIKITRQNGDIDYFSFTEDVDRFGTHMGKIEYEYKLQMLYRKNFLVTDLGNFNAKIEYIGCKKSDGSYVSVEFTANSLTDSAQPSGDDKLSETTTKPQSEDKLTYSTSDTAVDNKIDNKPIQTGDTACSAIIIVSMIMACLVLAYVKRERFYK